MRVKQREVHIQENLYYLIMNILTIKHNEACGNIQFTYFVYSRVLGVTKKKMSRGKRSVLIMRLEITGPNIVNMFPYRNLWNRD
jgi:hypothetical protein